jgi:hypothetical protein
VEVYKMVLPAMLIPGAKILNAVVAIVAIYKIGEMA